VLIRIADPRAFFDPIDAATERLEELLLNPGWSYTHLGSGHYERLLFGADALPPCLGECAIHIRLLETDDEHFAYALDEPPPQGRWRISGLGLPDDALDLVYGGNAQRLIPVLGCGSGLAAARPCNL